MRYILILSMLFFCMSCESADEFNGYLVDKATRQPISNAKVYSYAARKKRQDLAHETYTDSNGFFHAYYPIQGCGFGNCPILRVVIVKEGYRTTKFEGAELRNTDTLFLESDQ
jgi:hypothetical protein